MAHPYAKHKEHHAAKKRVSKIFKGHAARVEHESGKEVRIANGRSKGRADRYARGGAAKKHHVNVNVINLPRDGTAGGSPPGMTPGAPMGAAPPGLTPGLPRKDGGRASYISGVSTPENLAKWSRYSRSNTKVGGTMGRNSTDKTSISEMGPNKQLKAGRDQSTKPQTPKVWRSRQGGSSRTEKPGKMLTSNKIAGQGSGLGLKLYAKHMKTRYP